MRFKINLAFRRLAGKLWKLTYNKIHRVDSTQWGRKVNKIANLIHPSPFTDTELETLGGPYPDGQWCFCPQVMVYGPVAKVVEHSPQCKQARAAIAGATGEEDKPRVG